MYINKMDHYQCLNNKVTSTKQIHNNRILHIYKFQKCTKTTRDEIDR